MLTDQLPVEQEQNKLVSKGVEEITSPVQQCSFGKNLVLFKSKRLTIFLGPDYCMFIPTFLCFAAISILTVLFIDASTSNSIIQIATKIVCFGHTLSYLAVALKDPGVEKPKQYISEGINRTSKCRRCGYYVNSGSIHCMQCDVCIEGYDHHCPWTSKCIGKGNIVPFYIFLIMTPVLILYCSISLGVVLQSQPYVPQGQPGPTVQK